MAILEKEVLIRLSSSNTKHYEKLGYEIPRSINKYGRLTIPLGTEILVKVEDLLQSKIKVTKICDDCGKIIPEQVHSHIITSRKKGDGKDRCEQCGRKFAANNLKNNVKYENSLEYWAKENNKEYLLTEFSENNTKKPCEISHGNGDFHLWKCSNCKNEYDMTISDRKGRYSCPYCSGHRLLKGYNDLWTTHPEIANLLKDQKRGYEISYGSHTTEIFICPDCNYEKPQKLVNVIYQGFSCPKCSDGTSYPEKFMFNLLEQLNVDFETQKIFDWSDGKRYDFYVSSINLIIETHGVQHYENNKRGKSLDEEQENDRLKEELAKENGIKSYSIIDCRKSEFEWIKNNIFKSELNEIFDLSKINWLECHEFACKSLVKTICEIWNNDTITANEIGKVLKLDRSTVRKYLKQAAKLGWCEYDPKEEMRKSGIKNSPFIGKKVIQLTKNDEYIKEWNSVTEASEELKIHSWGIYNSARNNKIYKGFKWIYLVNE